MLARLATPLALAALLAVAGAQADAKSDALLKKARETAAKAKSLDADLSLTMTFDGQSQSVSGTIRVLKPNYGHAKVTMPDGKTTQELISDGKDMYIVMAAEKTYLKSPLDSGGPTFAAVGGAPTALFLSPETFGTNWKHRAAASQKVDGKTYQVVEVIPSPGGAEQKLFIGASGLIEGVEMTTRQGDKASIRTTWLKNIRLDRSTDPKRFAYAPPADFALHEQPDLNKALLAVGTDAPDFMLPQPGGGQLSLSDARKGKKAVLINFWFYS